MSNIHIAIDQQPLKKQKLESNTVDNNNNNNSCNNLNNIINKPQSLINLIDVISHYKHNQNNTDIKLKIIKYFNKYHYNKYPHYYNFNSFINFVLDIFFDPSIEIFNEIENISKSYADKYLYNCIVNDKRFKEWFMNHYENNIQLLKDKFKTLNFKTKYFNIEKVYSALNSNNNNNDDNNDNKDISSYSGGYFRSKEKKRINKISIDKHYKYRKIYKNDDNCFVGKRSRKDSSNNNNNSIDNGARSDNNKQIILQDYIIQKILFYSIESAFENDCKNFGSWINSKQTSIGIIGEKNESRLWVYNISIFSDYAMVSKQFLRVFSRLFKQQELKQNYFYPWKVIKGVDIKNLGSLQIYPFSFINQDYPITLHYEYIRSIPYDISKENLLLYFSKVESFYISSDECDNKSYHTYPYDYETERNLSWFIGGRNFIDKYRESIQEDDYLVIPPRMPSLKNLSINNYIGYYYKNYSNFLIYILTNCPNNFDPTRVLLKDNQNQSNQDIIKCQCNSCNGNGGIEHFSINIKHPPHIYIEDIDDSKREFSFFKVLLLCHSKSLKTIQIKSTLLEDEFLQIFDQVIGFKNNTININIEYVTTSKSNNKELYNKYLNNKNQLSKQQ